MTPARRTAALVATLALTAGTAAAQTTFSGTAAAAATAQANFLASLTGPSYTENFDGLAIGANAITLPGIGVFGGGNGVTSGNPYVNGGTTTSLSNGFELYTDNGSGTASASFAFPVSAFGFYATDLEDAFSVNVQLVGGTSNSFTINGFENGGRLYYGLNYGANLILGVTLTAGSGDGVLLDDVTVSAAASTVPEPSTYALLGSGLLGIAGLARRRRAAA